MNTYQILFFRCFILKPSFIIWPELLVDVEPKFLASPQERLEEGPPSPLRSVPQEEEDADVKFLSFNTLSNLIFYHFYYV